VCSFDRKRIAYVPQEAVIFSGSIRENIDYSSKGLTDTKLTAICKDAGIFELIMSLPDKF
jgi:ATP-binding cassette subfamily B protein